MQSVFEDPGSWAAGSLQPRVWFNLVTDKKKTKKKMKTRIKKDPTTQFCFRDCSFSTKVGWHFALVLLFVLSRNNVSLQAGRIKQSWIGVNKTMVLKCNLLLRGIFDLGFLCVVTCCSIVCMAYSLYPCRQLYLTSVVSSVVSWVWGRSFKVEA